MQWATAVGLEQIENREQTDREQGNQLQSPL